MRIEFDVFFQKKFQENNNENKYSITASISTRNKPLPKNQKEIFKRLPLSY